MAIGVNIDMLLDMLLAFLYLVYMNKIREAIVKRDGIADRGLICCGDPCSRMALVWLVDLRRVGAAGGTGTRGRTGWAAGSAARALGLEQRVQHVALDGHVVRDCADRCADVTELGGGTVGADRRQRARPS